MLTDQLIDVTRQTLTLMLLLSTPVLLAGLVIGLIVSVMQAVTQIQERLAETGFSEMFPPEGTEIVDHYVMMGIGQVIVLRVPPES